MRLLLSALLSVLLLGGCASAPPGPLPAAEDQSPAVNAVLDDLHKQAAAANFAKYFALYTDDAVFLGTDRDEYWPIAVFKQYAQPHFERGTGWTYTPLKRELHFHDGDTAWFEEELRSEKYGRVRGTGVLIRSGSGWKVAQYNLTLPIPNPMFGEIAKQIEAHYGSNESGNN